MPAQSPPWAHVVEVVVKGRIHGSETNNVFHFASNVTVWDNPNALNEALLALLVAILQCFTEHFRPAVTVDWQGLELSARPLTPSFGDEQVLAFPADFVGEGIATDVSFAATLVNIKTGGGGRSGRGKKFFPPPGSDNINNSVISGTTLADLQAFLACIAGKFMGANATTDWRLGVYSPTVFKKLIGGGFDNAFRQATSLTPSTVAAKLGSRKLGSGS